MFSVHIQGVQGNILVLRIFLIIRSFWGFNGPLGFHTCFPYEGTLEFHTPMSDLFDSGVGRFSLGSPPRKATDSNRETGRFAVLTVDGAVSRLAASARTAGRLWFHGLPLNRINASPAVQRLTVRSTVKQPAQ